MKILLLGVGLQGKAALQDLVNSPAVTQIIAADANYDDLTAYVETLKTNKVTPVKLDVRDNAQVAEQMQLVQAAIVLLHLIHKIPVQGIRHFGWRGIYKGRAAALAAIGQKGELGDHQHLPPDV